MKREREREIHTLHTPGSALANSKLWRRTGCLRYGFLLEIPVRGFPSQTKSLLKQCLFCFCVFYVCQRTLSEKEIPS